MPNPDVSIHSNQRPHLNSLYRLRLREDTAFTSCKGLEKSGVRKRAEKTLSKLREALLKMLSPEEVILYLARAQAPAGLFEQWSFGWYIYSVTRTMLVFTNRRIIHLLVKGNGDWKRSLRSVQWGDLANAKVKGWALNRTLRLTYRNGQNEDYWGLGHADAKKIKVLLGALLPGSAGEGSPAQGMVQLCPSCTATLSPESYKCRQCNLSFKDMKTMVRRSLLIPGGGYFYTGHWVLGLADFLVEAILLYLTVFAFLVGLGVVQPGTGPEDVISPAAAFGEGIFYAAILSFEKWLTIHHCRRFIRDHIPTG